MGKAEKEHHLS